MAFLVCGDRMAGNKNSGNRSRVEKDIMKINLDLCDTLCNRFLKDETIPLADRVKAVIPLIGKKIPAINEMRGEVKFTHMGRIKINGAALEVGIGD